MIKKINIYLLIYFTFLLLFSFFFLFIKHDVGNDSTISEWIINYEGGFTKRGLIGQLAIIQARILEIELRVSILIFQISIITIYFILLFILFKKLKFNKIIILSIFTPIFILYPIAEIEVLARKEIIIFCLFLIYILIPRNYKIKNFSFIIFTSLSVLIWEPVIFFFPLFLLLEILERNIEKFNLETLKILFYITPSIFIALIFIFHPLSKEEWTIMANVLKNEFSQNCYMSCDLLRSKSSLLQQFQGNFGKYSVEVFVRYILIILVGFYPLLVLLDNSSLKNNDLFIFKYFLKPIYPTLISLMPVFLLFAMGYDWGRWVNISYVFLIIFYFYLYNKKIIILDYHKLKNNFLSKISKKLFITLFILYCFGWNPKTVITGDIASFPGYRIPYKVFKILSN